MDTPNAAPPGDEPDFDEPDFDEGATRPGGQEMSGPPHPVNWNLLLSHDLEVERLELNRWVNWLRRTYRLPASVIPPFWHHHPELLWELSALHLHWLCAYDPAQDGSAPLGWHRDFADARQRLRDWVAAWGTRLDRDSHVWPSWLTRYLLPGRVSPLRVAPHQRIPACSCWPRTSGEGNTIHEHHPDRPAPH